MKYNKGFAPLIIALIVVGALVIGGGAYWWGNKGNKVEKEVNIKENNQVNNLPSDQNQNNNQEIKNTDNNSISNLKTYTSTSYLYKFNYNSTRFISDPNPQGKEVSINNGDCVSSECVSLYKVEFKSDINNLTDLKSYIKNTYTMPEVNWCKQNITWTENMKIDNQKTIQLNRTVCAGAGAGEKYPIPVLGTIYNNNAYIISTTGQSGGEYTGEYKTEFDNLVSSFKFLDGIVTTCDLNVTLSNKNPLAQVITAGTANFKFMSADLTAVGCDMKVNNIDVIVGQFIPSIPVENLISNLVIKDESNLKLNNSVTPSYGSNNMTIPDLTIKKGETKQISIFADIKSSASGRKEAFGINIIATGSDGLKLNTGQLDSNHMTIK